MPLDRIIGADSANGWVPDRVVDATTQITQAPVAVAREPFVPRLSLYNWKPSNTSRLRAAIARSIAGGAGSILFAGDSITAGVNNGGAWDITTKTDAWPYRFRDALEQVGVPIIGDGTVWAYNGSSSAIFLDGRYTVSSSANWPVGSILGFALTSVVNGAWIEFQSDRPGTVVEIIYLDQFTGPFTYSIDGGTPVTVNPAGAFAAIVISVTGLTNIRHKVRITKTNTTTTGIAGVAVHGTTGLEVSNGGFGGAPASSWSAASAYYQAGPITRQVVDPDAVFMLLEANDINLSTALATYGTNLTTAAQNYLNVDADVVLMTTVPTGDVDQPDYDAVIYAVADALDIPVIDLAHHFANKTLLDANGLSIDTLHPNKYGLAEMGSHVAAIVVPGATVRAQSNAQRFRGTGAGKWFNPGRGAPVATAVALYPLGWGVYNFFDLDETKRFDMARVYVTGAAGAGGVMRPAIWHDAGTEAGPGVLAVDFGTIDTTVLGGRSTTVLATPASLPPGRYWYTGTHAVAGATIYCFSNPIPAPVALPAAAEAYLMQPANLAMGAGAAASPAPAPSTGYNLVPAIEFRLA